LFCKAESVAPYLKIDDEDAVFPQTLFVNSCVSQSGKYQFVYDKDNAVLDFFTRDTLLKFPAEATIATFRTEPEVAAINEEDNCIYYNSVGADYSCLIRRSFIDLNQVDTFLIAPAINNVQMVLSSDFKYLYWLDDEIILRVNLITQKRDTVFRDNSVYGIRKFSISEDKQTLSIIYTSGLSVFNLKTNSELKFIEGSFCYSYLTSQNKYAILYSTVPQKSYYYNIYVYDLVNSIIIDSIQTVYSYPVKVMQLSTEKYFFGSTFPASQIFDTEKKAIVKCIIPIGNYYRTIMYNGSESIFMGNINNGSSIVFDWKNQKVLKKFGSKYTAIGIDNKNAYFSNNGYVEKYSLENKNKDEDLGLLSGIRSYSAMNGALFYYDVELDSVCFGELLDNHIINRQVINPTFNNVVAVDVDNKSILLANKEYFSGNADTIYIKNVGDITPRIFFLPDDSKVDFKFSDHFKYAVHSSTRKGFYLIDFQNNSEKIYINKDSNCFENENRNLCFSKDEKNLYFTNNNYISLYDIEKKKIQNICETKRDTNYYVNSCLASEDNSILLVEYHIGCAYITKNQLQAKIEIINLSNREIIKTIYFNKNVKIFESKNLFAISPDKRFLITGDNKIFETGINLGSVLPEIDKENNLPINLIQDNDNLQLVSNRGCVTRWEIYTYFGDLVLFDNNCNSECLQIETTNLTAGRYFIKINIDGKAIVRSINL
jgi:hypothetical protein